MVVTGGTVPGATINTPCLALDFPSSFPTLVLPSLSLFYLLLL